MTRNRRVIRTSSPCILTHRSTGQQVEGVRVSLVFRWESFSISTRISVRLQVPEPKLVEHLMTSEASAIIAITCYYIWTIPPSSGDVLSKAGAMCVYSIHSMYAIDAYIDPPNHPNVGKWSVWVTYGPSPRLRRCVIRLGRRCVSTVYSLRKTHPTPAVVPPQVRYD